MPNGFDDKAHAHLIAHRIGSRLRTARQSLGWTQSIAAERLDLSIEGYGRSKQGEAATMDAGMRRALFDRLDRAVADDAPDPAFLGGLLQRIGQESCGPCNRVLIPAACSKHVAPGDTPPPARPAAKPATD